MNPSRCFHWLFPLHSLLLALPLAVAAAACASISPPPAATAAPAKNPSPPPGTSAGTGGAVSAATQPVSPSPSSPAQRPASDILSDAVKAVGTPEAWSAHQSAHMTMTMTFQGVGITGTAQRFATARDKALVVTEIPGVGVIREGSNGKVFWSQDPINGLRLLDGAEADQARIESVWNPELRVADLFSTVEAKNQPGADGKILECVVLTPKIAPPTTRCFDPATHLQTLETGVRPTPQGDTPFSSTVGDWRTVGGLKTAFALETQAGPITFVAKVQSLVFDEPMDDEKFEPPHPAAVTPANASGKEETPTAKNKAKNKTNTPKGADKNEPAKKN